MPRIARLHTFGGPDGLQIDDLPARQPGPGEARLRVEAVGLSRDQFMFLAGHQFSGSGFTQPPLPSRLGYEVAGVVDAVGDGVDESWIGKRVAPVSPFDEARYGCLGEEGIVPAELLWEYPDRLSPAQAAAFWVPYLTAYGVLAVGGIRAGDVVALPATASAVGAAATQIVLDAGATPVAVTRSAAKADLLREIGAAQVIVTDTEDYVTRIAEITDGQGARVTFDPIGGEFLTEAATAASVGGVVIEYGILAGEAGRFPQNQVIGKGLTIRGFTVSEIVADPARLAAAKDYFTVRLTNGRFTPTVAATYGLDDLVAAYDAVEANQQIGRVVITP